MKLLVSSKQLAKKLSELPEMEFVLSATLRRDEKYKDAGILLLLTQTKAIEICVHILKFEAALNQEGRRWDGIYRLVKKCQEQPITLELFPRVTNVIFQY